MDYILARRSIRKYTDRPVPDEMIEYLLKAAMAAPSAGNQQPWHFVVVRDRGILEQIPKFHPYSQMLKEASAAILVCGDTEKEHYPGYWVEDCSAATENILLAAHSKGLGAVWLGIYPREDRVAGTRQLMGLPAGIIPLSLVSVGYPAEEKAPSDRFDKSRIHYEKW